MEKTILHEFIKQSCFLSRKDNQIRRDPTKVSKFSPKELPF